MNAITDITNFIFIEGEPKVADIIFIPGGSYAELGEKAAKLWHDRYAPLILPSGRHNPHEKLFFNPSVKTDNYGSHYNTEWDFCNDVLYKNGVDKNAILREDTAESTYENAFKSREITDNLGLHINRAIICCKSSHARRCYMYYQWAFPNVELIICPCDVQGIRKDNWFTSEVGINVVMDEVRKIGTQFKNYFKENILFNFEISYPTQEHRNYIEAIYKFCKSNRLSLILKGSLAKGTATKFSDIDLIILGEVDNFITDELINVYGNPVMTNLTENPKGILILVYNNNISVDLDIRNAISEDDLQDGLVLLKYSINFIVDKNLTKNRSFLLNYILEKPNWYKTLRLIHRAVIKYLSNKIDTAYNLLEEIKENLFSLHINDLVFNNNFEDDIQYIFSRISAEFEVDDKINSLFNNLFSKF
ncbi:ElyC/SanA/YdcF family protein [Clostridium sp. C8-1-8]|uniref:ElyC/SanA/YdcF family protein n=1 Tax=Clostridium sp. C8-1-8 TaxID=2698831 RepID=UPI001FAD0DB5|nr:ElyC/SanA/YdcF family protein [Clostridium sp. C8-1-8]